MVEKYYENFPRLPLPIVADLAIQLQLRSVTDARIATHGRDVLLELVEGNLNLSAETMLGIAEYFDTSYHDVGVRPGHRPGLLVIEILDQRAFPLAQAYRGDIDVIEVDDYADNEVEVEFDPYEEEPKSKYCRE